MKQGSGQGVRGLLRGLPWWLRLHGALVLAFVWLPVAVLVVYSFSDSASAMKWGGFTLRWHEGLWEHGRLQRALTNTLTVAAAASALGVVLGALAATGRALLRRGGAAVEGLLLLPLMAPDIVIALSLKLWCVQVFAMRPGLLPVVLGHSLPAAAYVFLVTGTRLQRMDWRLVEAARDLGAGPVQVLRFVLWPQMWPGVAGGGLLALGVSLDEYVIASFLSGPGTATVPVEVAGMIRKTFTPEINALAVLLLGISLLLAVAAVLLQRRR